MRPDIWKKEGILSLALGLLGLAAASYFLLFVPELREIHGLKAEIARKNAEASEAMTLRAKVAESRTGEGERWDRRLRSWEERVPATKDTDRLLAEIASLAVRHNLKSFGLTAAADPSGQGVPPQEPAGGAPAPGGPERLSEMRYEITFLSTYKELAEFLDDIPRMRRLLTVRSVTIKEKSGSMAAAVEISAWHRGTP